MLPGCATGHSPPTSTEVQNAPWMCNWPLASNQHRGSECSLDVQLATRLKAAPRFRMLPGCAIAFAAWTETFNFMITTFDSQSQTRNNIQIILSGVDSAGSG